MNKLKGAWRSMTLWFNALFLLLIGNLDAIASALPQLEPYLKPGQFHNIMIVGIFVNMALRFKTTTDLAHK